MIVVGIDAGTQSVKIIVYDSDVHSIIAESSSPLSLIEKDGGVREQDACWWIDAIAACFSSIGEDLRQKIDVISVSGQQHGFVPLSASGDVLTSVKLWCDTSTAPWSEALERKLGGRDALSKRIGNPILPGYTAGKIQWLYSEHREIYDSMAYVLLPHDYINYVLTGRIVMEKGDASGTGLMNIYEGKWDEEAVSAISPTLMSKLPDILDSPCIIGSVSSSAAARFGLSMHTLVASGGGDNMMSAIGTGAVRDGVVTMSLGTSGTLFSSSSKAVHDDKARLASFCSSHGTWLPLLCTMNCTVATESMRKLLDVSVKEFDEKAASAEPGASGMMMLPFLNGERVPDFPRGEGVLFGMRPGNLTSENIARAAIEGVTYEFLGGLDAFIEQGVSPSALTLTGGGANSLFWRQLVSDMTGLPVRVPVVNEAAAFGAALQGLWLSEGRDITEVIDEHLAFNEERSAFPDESMKTVYAECYEKWKTYCASVAPIFS